MWQKVFAKLWRDMGSTDRINMNIVSLFAGCGGLDLGFEKAGFNIIWANEYDQTIHETYRINHPNTVLNTSDIRDISGSDIPDCDGVIGGPPCQSWSEGGKGLGLADPRGAVFLDYIRIIKEKRPKFFVIENVKGILEERHRESLKQFINLFKEAGYRIKYELLNAVNYKIPQDRYRVFFVGIRKDLKNNFNFPDAKTNVPISLHQAISDIADTPVFYDKEPVIKSDTTLPNHDVYNGRFDDIYMSRNRVRSWNEPSFTIQAQARNIPIHPQAPKMDYISANLREFRKGYEYLYRRLSVRECARIQTFPDKFIFKYSNIKDGYKMVGNAVPPRLAWYIAEQIKLAFSQEIIVSDFSKEREGMQINAGSISVKDIARHHTGFIINNSSAPNIEEIEQNSRVLIGLVSEKNAQPYLNKSSTKYYTGRRFPASLSLTGIKYFMPYIKGKGVRDIYVVKIVRIGCKQEFYPSCSPDDLRLVFEIEFVKQIFESYIPIHLNIWHTFTTLSLEKLLKLKEMDNSMM